jgi:hypothetical protein
MFHREYRRAVSKITLNCKSVRKLSDLHPRPCIVPAALFLGVKRRQREADHSPPSNALPHTTEQIIVAY